MTWVVTVLRLRMEILWRGLGFSHWSSHLQFLPLTLSSIAAFLTQSVCLDDTTVKFEIWDTAGQERYHSLAPMYYRGAQAAIVVYDITNQVSGLRRFSCLLFIGIKLGGEEKTCSWNSKIRLQIILLSSGKTEVINYQIWMLSVREGCLGEVSFETRFWRWWAWIGSHSGQPFSSLCFPRKPSLEQRPG